MPSRPCDNCQHLLDEKVFVKAAAYRGAGKPKGSATFLTWRCNPDRCPQCKAEEATVMGRKYKAIRYVR